MQTSKPPRWSVLRRLAVEHGVHERTIEKEWEDPGSVAGFAGERARAAIKAYKQTAPSRSRTP